MLAMAFAIFFVVLSSLLLSGSVSNQQEVTTIKTKHGVYDCVDFYKQPAFDNPLLKNLTFQVIPKNKLAVLQGRNNDFGLKDGGCPMGTVPILRAISNSSQFPQTPSSNGNCVAVVETIQRAMDPTKDFYGVDASISLHKPRARKTQWSAARLRLRNGVEFMEAGWMVNPDLYKDNEAHLYVKYESRRPECSSHSCFVQVARGVPLGLVPKHYSEVNGAKWSWNISIVKHEDDGNWWLTITANNYAIGYWPKRAFATLAYVAEQVEWGGEISSESAEPNQLPEMGAGQPANYDPKLSAHIWRITVVRYFQGTYQIFNPEDTKKVSNCKRYTVEDGGCRNEHYGCISFFGGPGVNLS